MLLPPPIVAAGTVTDSLGREWDPLLHPRDRKGKFIHTFRSIRAFLTADGTDAWATGEVEEVNADGSIRMRVTKVADAKYNEYVGQLTDVPSNQVENINEKATLNVKTSSEIVSKWDFTPDSMRQFFDNAGYDASDDPSSEVSRVAVEAESLAANQKNQMTTKTKLQLAQYAKSVSGDSKQYSDADFMELLGTLDVDPDVIDDTPDGMSGLKALSDAQNAGKSPNNKTPDAVDWWNENPPTTAGVVRELQRRNSDVKIRFYDDGTQTIVWPDGTEVQHDKNAGDVLAAGRQAHEAPGTTPDEAKADLTPAAAPDSEDEDGPIDYLPEFLPDDTPFEDPDADLDESVTSTEAPDNPLSNIDVDDLRAIADDIEVLDLDDPYEFTSVLRALADSIEDEKIDAKEVAIQLDILAQDLDTENDQESSEFQDVIAQLNEQMLLLDGTEQKASLGDPSWNDDETVGAPDEVASEPTQVADVPEVPDTWGGVVDAAAWKQISGQAGSNQGGVFEDAEGNQYYVKSSKTPHHAKNEALAAKLYQEAGVYVAPQNLTDTPFGTVGTSSPLVPGAKQDLSSHLNDKPYIATVHEGMVVDAWLANWDVAGASFDNIVSDGEGSPVRIDPGGALWYRAMGENKGGAFGYLVPELDRFKKEGNASQIFGGIDYETEKASAQRVLSISPERIDELVNAMDFNSDPAGEWPYGYSPVEPQVMKSVLKSRREYIADYYGLTLPEDDLQPVADLDSQTPDGPVDLDFVPAHTILGEKLYSFNVDDDSQYTNLDDAATPEMGEALRSYSHNNKIIQDYARNGVETENGKKWSEEIDELFKHSKTAQDMQVVRSVMGSTDDEHIQQLISVSPGAIIEDRGYSGTTTSKYSTNYPYGNANASARVRMNINVPEGSYGIALNPTVKKLTGKSAQNSQEHEFLLPRNSKFEVVSVSEGDDKTTKVVTVNLLPQDDAFLPVQTTDDSFVAPESDIKLPGLSDPVPSVTVPDDDLPGPNSTDFKGMVDAEGQYRWTPDGKKIRLGMKATSLKDGLTGTLFKFENNTDGVVILGDDGKKRARKIKTLQINEAQEPAPAATPDPASDPASIGSNEELADWEKELLGIPLDESQGVQPPVVEDTTTPEQLPDADAPFNSLAEISSIRASIPTNIGKVKQAFPGSDDYTAKQIRNAGFALDDMVKETPNSAEWTKSYNRASYLLGEGGVSVAPIRTSLIEWHDKTTNAPSPPSAQPSEPDFAPDTVVYNSGVVWKKMIDGSWESSVWTALPGSPKYTEIQEDAADLYGKPGADTSASVSTVSLPDGYAELDDGDVPKYKYTVTSSGGLDVIATQNAEGNWVMYYSNGSKEINPYASEEGLASSPEWQPYSGEVDKPSAAILPSGYAALDEGDVPKYKYEDNGYGIIATQSTNGDWVLYYNDGSKLPNKYMDDDSFGMDPDWVPYGGEVPPAQQKVLPGQYDSMPDGSVPKYMYTKESTPGTKTVAVQNADGTWTMYYEDGSTWDSAYFSETTAQAGNSGWTPYEGLDPATLTSDTSTMPPNYEALPDGAKIIAYESAKSYGAGAILVENSDGSLKMHFPDSGVVPGYLTKETYLESSNWTAVGGTSADDSVSAPVAVQKTGPSMAGSDGKPIYVGDKVVSTSDGLTYTVIKFESNGTGMVIMGADGKKKARKANKLTTTEAVTAPEPIAVHEDHPMYGQPKPETPPAPEGMEIDVWVEDTWIDSVSESYKSSTGKDLTSSKNWSRYEQVIKTGSISDLDYLRNKNFITQEQYDLAKSDIDFLLSENQAKLDLYKEAKLEYAKQLGEWAYANGYAGADHPGLFQLKGLYTGEKTFASNQEGSTWGHNIWSEYNKTVTYDQRNAVEAYTGSSYTEINGKLQTLKEKSLLPSNLKSVHKHIDSYLDNAPRVPEDIVVVRGNGFTGWVDPVSKLSVGALNADKRDQAMRDLKGTVQVNWGYQSATTGNVPGYSDSKPVWMYIRVPQDAKAAYVSAGVSAQGDGEYEILLDRGWRMYVHNSYYGVPPNVPQNYYGQKWIVDVEIVPPGWVPPAVPGDPEVFDATGGAFNPGGIGAPNVQPLAPNTVPSDEPNFEFD